MLEEEYRIRKEDWSRIDNYFKRNKNLSLFACFPIIQVFLNSHDKKTYLINFKGRDRLVFFRDKRFKDIRILFDQHDEDKEFMEILKDKTDHLGYSFTENLPNESLLNFEEREFFLNVDKVVSMKGSAFKGVRKNYNSFLKKHSSLNIVDVKKDDIERVKTFLHKWEDELNKEYNLKLKIHNELLLVNNFLGNNKISGTLILDKNDVVGMELCILSPSDNKYGFSILNKCLRGYSGLGTFLKVNQARRLLNEDVEFLNCGVAVGKNLNHFKKKFMEGGKYHNRYHYSIRAKENLILENKDLKKLWYSNQ